MRGDKAIAVAPLGLNIKRVLGLIAQFLAEPTDEHFEITRLGNIFGSPDMFEKVAMRERNTGVMRQFGEQPVLGRRQPDNLAAQSHLMGIEVN